MELRRELINNPNSDRVRKLVGLSRRSFRIKQGLTLVEGPQAVREAIVYASDAIRDLYVDESAIETQQELITAALDKNLWVHPVSSRVFKTFTEAAQGICATLSLDYFANGTLPELASKGRRTVILPETQDPGNLGTIMRLADACNYDFVVVIKGSADPYAPKVIRSSVGSVFHLPVLWVESFEAAVAELKAEGFIVAAADAHDAQPLPEFLNELNGSVTPEKSLCWVFGNEAHGLTANQLELCDASVTIPLPGRAESLNVAGAAAIMLYQSI